MGFYGFLLGSNVVPIGILLGSYRVPIGFLRAPSGFVPVRYPKVPTGFYWFRTLAQWPPFWVPMDSYGYLWVPIRFSRRALIVGFLLGSYGVPVEFPL